MTDALCYTLDEQSAARQSPHSTRRVELVPVGRTEDKETSSLSSAKTEDASWVISVEKQLSRMLELQPDWDSYGASPIALESVDTMIKVLRDIMNADTPPPTIVPIADGHLQAEWHARGIDLEVEVFHPLRIEISYSGPDDEWDEVLSVDLRPLIKIVDRLSIAP